MVQRLVGGSSLPTDEALAVRAADRDWWAAKAPQVLEWYAYCPKIGTLQSLSFMVTVGVCAASP